MKQKKNQTSVIDWLGESATTIYLMALFVIFPLFCTDKLFRIAEDKKQFFLYLTGIYGILLLILKGGSLMTQPGKSRLKLDADFIFLGILAASVALSTFFALDRSEAFYGLTERRIGALAMAACIICYLGLRKYGRMNKYIIRSILIGSSLLYLCGVLMACDINVMHLKDNLANVEIHLTPIGNADFNATYLCLMLPPVAVFYLSCKDILWKRVYGAVCYLAFLFLFFIKAQSALIGGCMMFACLLYYALEQKEWMKRYLELLTLFVGALATICVLLALFPNKIYPFDSLSLILLKPGMILAELAVLAALWAIWVKFGDTVREKILSYRKKLLYAFIGIVIACALLVLFINTAFHNAAASSWLKVFLLSDKSFNHRGFIWIRTLRELTNSPLANVLFGHGLNCFYQFITPNYYDEMIEVYSSVFVDPHNEFLQVLVTMGITGVIGYFGLILTVFIRAMRSSRDRIFQIAAVVTFAVYLVQGIVNIATIYCLPLFFVLLGLASGEQQLALAEADKKPNKAKK